MHNAGLDEAQAGMNIVEKNIKKLSMQMTPHLMAESKKS